jgi:hypothetical protein
MTYPEPRVEDGRPVKASTNNNRYQFSPPRTITGAEVEILRLRRAVRDMNAQLQDRNRLDLSGNRLSPREYTSWRGRTLRARSCAIEALDAYTAWKQQQRGACSQVESCAIVAKLRHAVTLADHLLTSLLADVDDISDEERRLAERFRAALASCPGYASEVPHRSI